MNKNNFYEKEFLEISKLIQNKRKKELDLTDFHRIRNFKLQNSSRAEEKNIKEKTKKAFKLAKNNVVESIKILDRIDGVGIPIASTILAMKFPKKFAIIDINVLRAIGKDKEWEDYKENPERYKEYNNYLLSIKPKDKNLRDFEFDLFKEGKKMKKRKKLKNR